MPVSTARVSVGAVQRGRRRIAAETWGTKASFDFPWPSVSRFTTRTVAGPLTETLSKWVVSQLCEPGQRAFAAVTPPHPAQQDLHSDLQHQCYIQALSPPEAPIALSRNHTSNASDSGSSSEHTFEGTST
jgi:hypothetical protein